MTNYYRPFNRIQPSTKRKEKEREKDEERRLVYVDGT